MTEIIKTIYWNIIDRYNTYPSISNFKRYAAQQMEQLSVSQRRQIQQYRKMILRQASNTAKEFEDFWYDEFERSPCPDENAMENFTNYLALLSSEEWWYLQNRGIMEGIEIDLKGECPSDDQGAKLMDEIFFSDMQDENDEDEPIMIEIIDVLSSSSEGEDGSDDEMI